MSIYLICLTTDGGLPVFTRKKGDCDNLPFSTISLLNGLHIFFKSLGILLESTSSENFKFVWRDFKNAITLIIFGRGTEESGLEKLAELVFNAFALFVSQDDLNQPTLMKRMKKEAKNYMGIVDAAMDLTCSQVLGYTDCILAIENSTLLQRLNEFSNQCGSLFCCMAISQRVAVATEGWWNLSSLERQLLLLLLNSSNTLQNDIPVYLPIKSPNIAYRFVSVPLTPNTVVLCLLGVQPTYRELHVIAQNIFHNESTMLQNIERLAPRSLPEHIIVDENVLSIILVNTDTRKCVVNKQLHQSANQKRILNGPDHLDMMLKKFVEHSFQAIQTLEKENFNKFGSITHTKVLEQYWCLDYHKCHTICDDKGNAIFVLYNASLPNYTMKYITKKLLNSILYEKALCW